MVCVCEITVTNLAATKNVSIEIKSATFVTKQNNIQYLDENN
jgi:hypothetical protein